MLQLRIVPAALDALLLMLVVRPAASSCTSQPPICPLGMASGTDCRIEADCTVASDVPFGASFDFTSTTVPPPGTECAQQPTGFEAATCRIGTLTDTLGTSSPDALGGKATAKRLNALLDRTNRFLDLAAGNVKVKVNLRKARQQLKVFEKAVERGLERKRGSIEPELGEIILGLAKDATNDVEVVQAKLR